MDTHAQDLLACSDCQKSFAKRMDYNRHRKRHDRPHPCPLCEKRFGLKTDLDRHRRTHQHWSSRQNFKCKFPACNFVGTKRKDYLWKHIQKHGAKLDHNPSGKTLREYYHDSTRDGDGFQNQQELANLELLEAASTGDAEKVKELLSRHADINAMDASRKTPLHLAASKNHDLIVKLLCNHVANLQWELAKAIESGNYIVVKALIENGADISTDALHRAVYYRRGIIINLLLENGADVNLRQGGANKPDWHRTGITFEPLYMYSVLTPSYTKINFRDRLGGTPFDYCYFPFNETIANLLLEAGAIIEQYHWEAMPQWFRAWNAKYGPSPSSLLLGEFGNEFATLVGSEADQNTFQAIGGERWSL